MQLRAASACIQCQGYGTLFSVYLVEKLRTWLADGLEYLLWILRSRFDRMDDLCLLQTFEGPDRHQHVRKLVWMALCGPRLKVCGTEEEVEISHNLWRGKDISISRRSALRVSPPMNPPKLSDPSVFLPLITPPCAPEPADAERWAKYELHSSYNVLRCCSLSPWGRLIL